MYQRGNVSWRVRSNAELEELVAQLNNIGETKRNRLCGLSHLERKGREIRERDYLDQPIRRRPVGRPLE